MSQPASSAAPALSVIVAAYNIEQYISTCVDSVLDNTRGDYEVLIIDDGSTDDTARIVDRYASDTRVRIVHQPNSGLGGARNTGLDQARGQFIFFVDGDDWLASGAIDTCLHALGEYPDTDLFVFDYLNVEDDQTTRQPCQPSFWGCHNAAWNKLYARSLIGEQRFDTDILYEDLAQVRPWVARAKSIRHVDFAPYHYRNSRSGSIMSSMDTARFFDLLEAASRCAGRIETAFSAEPERLTRALGADWKRRLYTVDVFVPALVGWPRKLADARQRRRFAADFFSRLPEGVPDKTRLAQEYSYKIAAAAACYERGAFVAGDWLLHRLGRIKRRILSE